MILEHAVLDVLAGQEPVFEAAFARARPIIAAMPGFVDLRLSRCIENPSRYLLLVHWRQLEDHTEGFRGSAQYAEWRNLLHHFYDPFPSVEHYEAVAAAVPFRAVGRSVPCSGSRRYADSGGRSAPGVAA